MAIIPKDRVQQILVSEEERKTGKYNPRTLAQALGALHQDGLVVLKDVIPVEVIDKLNIVMCAEADRRINDPCQEYNHGIKSNFLQRPPINDPDCLSQDVYFNSFLLQLANAYLGHRPVWNWLTANTALANTGGIRQPAHKDSAFDHPLFPYYFIANIPLCDFTADNGSTEFWLGSHAHTTLADQEITSTPHDLKAYAFARLGQPVPPITAAAKEQRMKIRPPIQPECCRGDIMIRDIRTWHAGMPNSSSAHRIMLGLGYQSPHHANYTMRLHLPFAQREFFLQHGGDLVDVRAQLYSDDDFSKTKADTEFYLRSAYLE
ncbi:phytanoyl-dioxygenase family protein [Xylariales sp. PMI_506]|nr:phytanoyl-dioxygenase family protein [Xylariales sp. PMI_506]